MSELVITSKEDLEKMIFSIMSRILRFEPALAINTNVDERLNQKQAAEYLGITESTIIRWKKQGKVPYDQIPGSSKITFYKSQLKIVIQRNPGLLQAPRK